MGPRSPRGRGHFGGNVAASCKVMGHYTVSCAKTAEPIDVPFWMKTRVGPRNHVLDGDADRQGERAILRGCPGRSKARAIWLQQSLQRCCSVRCKRIIQSPITSCSKRDHSVCQASANSILKILGAGDAAYRP